MTPIELQRHEAADAGVSFDFIDRSGNKYRSFMPAAELDKNRPGWRERVAEIEGRPAGGRFSRFSRLGSTFNASAAAEFRRRRMISELAMQREG